MKETCIRLVAVEKAGEGGQVLAGDSVRVQEPEGWIVAVLGGSCGDHCWRAQWAGSQATGSGRDSRCEEEPS